MGLESHDDIEKREERSEGTGAGVVKEKLKSERAGGPELLREPALVCVCWTLKTVMFDCFFNGVWLSIVNTVSIKSEK